MKQHPGAAEAHYLAYLIPHIGTVAVHRTFVALGLGCSELAMIQTRQGVVKQLPALTAQLLSSVVLPAPQFNHMTYRPLLPGNPFHIEFSVYSQICQNQTTILLESGGYLPCKSCRLL